MKYIAEYKRPKQQITRKYGFVIKYDTNGTYSVWRKYYDRKRSYSDGYTHLTYNLAVEEFGKRVLCDLTAYPPCCNEIQEIVASNTQEK